MLNHLWCTGSSADLHEILENRERRCERQAELVTEYTHTVISFSLNIVGPVKDFPLARHTFCEGWEFLHKELMLSGHTILFEECVQTITGSEGLLVVDAPAFMMKQLMVLIEDTHALGRLFDLDVLDEKMNKMSRRDFNQPSRTCLLCEGPVFLCSSRRTHTVKDLFEKETDMMYAYFKKKTAGILSGLFVKSMTYEVTTTPKPGLVDRVHNGSHTDMDIGLFIDSIDALQSYFYDCAMTGFACISSQSDQLFLRLRSLGVLAEQAMLDATGGINTHKGLIFSGGILCGILAFSFAQNSSFHLQGLTSLCESTLQELTRDFKILEQNEPLSHGEHLYLQYGLMGIRGEAMKGFPTVLEIGLPVFKKALTRGCSLFRCGRITLLYLIAYSEDTNSITRSSFEVWKEIQIKLQKNLKALEVGTFDERKLIYELDTYFMDRNISPGGSADMLALVYFLYFLEDRFSGYNLY